MAAITAAAFTLLSAAPAASAQSTQAPATAAGGGTSGLLETLIGGALLLFAIAGLTLVLRRRRRSGGGSRRKPAHARATEASGDWRGGPSMPEASGAQTGPGADGRDSRYEDRSSWAPGANDRDWPYPDHPSWPAGSTGRPLTPDHPSWPASDVGRPIGYGRHDGTAPDFPYGDHPSWPAGPPSRPVASDDYPSWPAADPGGSWAASVGGPRAGGGPRGAQRDLAGEALAPAMHHDPYPQRPAPRVPPARGRHVRVPGGYSGYPAPGVPTADPRQRWSAQLARNAGPIPQTYYDLAFGDGRLQVVLTETPGASSGSAAAPGAGRVLQLPGPGMAGPVSWDTGEYASADSVRVAERVLADADQQAAAIRQEAASQAVAIREAAERETAGLREQAAAEAAPIREAAELDAAEIKQQAAAQVAAIREAAEQEIEELRAAVLAMSAELSRVAAYVTENLTSPGQPAVPPPRRAGPHTRTAPAEPGAEPSADPSAGKPGAGPRRRPAGRPGAGRETRPAPQPARKPGTSVKGRQIKAMHKMVAAFAVVTLVGAVAGSAEMARHGPSFFLFRNSGAGAGNSRNLDENQGPGQPDAPGAHHATPAGGAGSNAKAHKSGAGPKDKKSHSKKSHAKPPKNKQPKNKPGPKPAKSN